MFYNLLIFIFIPNFSLIFMQDSGMKSAWAVSGSELTRRSVKKFLANMKKKPKIKETG